MKKIIFAVCLLLIVISLASCGETEPQSKTYFEYFDTVSVVYSYLEDDPEFEMNCQKVGRLLEKYHRMFDIYYEYQGMNNLCTINKKAASEPVKVSEELMDFLVYAKKMYALSGGKMNIAIGSVTKLWHDCREKADDYLEEPRIPSRKELSEAAAHTSIDALLLDTDNMTVSFSDDKLRLDVGAIAKGYAVEMITRELRESGITSYVLNIGGNISAIGSKPNGKAWSTGITNPDKSSDQAFVCKVKLRDVACVTSGDYERFFTVDGVKYHHIIDPETLMPADYFSSVTIIAKDSAIADMLSTTLFCMSYEDGAKLAESFDDVDVLWVYKNGDTRMTDGFEKILTK